MEQFKIEKWYHKVIFNTIYIIYLIMSSPFILFYFVGKYVAEPICESSSYLRWGFSRFILGYRVQRYSRSTKKTSIVYRNYVIKKTEIGEVKISDRTGRVIK